jgi:hypothetical protein
MFHHEKTFADHVATAALCLLLIAVIDGAIELFEFATAINLWSTCGLIGLVLLGGIYLIMGAVEENSSFRRGLRWVNAWYRQRLRRKADEASPLQQDALAGAP